MAKKQELDAETMFEEFVERVRGMTEVVAVAIDPGAGGAIALMCGREYCVVDIPTVKISRKRTRKLKPEEQLATGKKTKVIDGTTTKFNYEVICDLFDRLTPISARVRVAVEQAQVQVKGKGANAYTGFRVGCSYAMWPLFLYSRGYPTVEPRPAEWKKAMGLIGRDKEECRLIAISRFPRAPLSRVQDHDRAEALLLADYLLRTLAALLQSGLAVST